MSIAQMSILRDNSGAVTYGLNFTEVKYSVLLSADTEVTLTVPNQSNNWEAIFLVPGGQIVYVAPNATATYPTTSSFTLTNSELATGSRKVKAGDVLHFITSDANAYITVLFYARSN